MSKQQQQRAQQVLDLVAELNPYNRQGFNQVKEFHIYQSGFLASYLASMCEEDPWIMKRLERHLQALRTKKR